MSLQRGDRFLAPVRPHEHQRVHRLHHRVVRLEPVPLGAGVGGEAVALGICRHARGAPGEGGVSVPAGGLDVPPGRPGRVRLVAAQGRDLRDEQRSEHSGGKPGGGACLGGRRASRGNRGGGEQDRSGGGEKEGVRAQDAHRHLE